MSLGLPSGSGAPAFISGERKSQERGPDRPGPVRCLPSQVLLPACLALQFHTGAFLCTLKMAALPVVSEVGSAAVAAPGLTGSAQPAPVAP